MQTRVHSSADAAQAASEGVLDARLAPAQALLGSGDVDVLSLDVFDTILWRKVPEPKDAFPLIGRRLHERGLLNHDVPVELFSRLRQAAEWAARQALTATGGGVEVTLEQIYERFPRFMLAGGLDAIVAAEVEVEREILVPDLDVLELIRAARDKGLRVVAVSDTYFSEANLRAFLSRPPAHAWMPDRIFASSAHGVGKASGLFSVVLHELKVSPDRVLHIGDNPGADVDPPRRLGMHAVLFERRPKVIEDLLGAETLQLRTIDANAAHALTTNDPDLGDFGLAALRSKVLHRAERAAHPAAVHPFWDYGAAVLGPILTGYAEWVVLRAQGAGIRTVHCLMREGALLAELINRAAPALGADVRAETLWMSRQVAQRASINTGDRNELQSLFQRRTLPTLTELCRTLGLDLERDLPRFADRADARLADGQLGAHVLEAIEEDAELRAKIVASAQATRARVLRLLQERNDEGRDLLLLVDLGWGGTIQAHVDQILREEDAGIHTLGLYLLTEKRAADRMMSGTALHGFLASAGVPDFPTQAIMRSPEILEQVCMPEHGTQVDLTEDLEPVLADTPSPHLQSAEIAAVQAGIFAFQRLWHRYGAVVPWGLRPLAEARELLLPMLARAVIAPTREEATAFGRWVHDEGFGSGDSETVISDTSAAAIPYVDPHALTWDLPFQEVYWPYALAALHDEPLGESAALVHAGHASPDTFSSELETGVVEFLPDTGWGFTATGMVRVAARSNRRGRSYARAELRADYVKRVRIEPAQAPCMIRIDWINLRFWPHDRSAPVDHRLAGPADLKGLEVKGASVLRPGLLMVPGRNPQVILDVEELAGQKLWKVEVAMGFAVLPLQLSQGRARYEGAKQRLAEFAKRSPLGFPVRLLRRVAQKLR